jgi:adenylate kinase
MEMVEMKKAVVLLGPPGSGKTSLAERLLGYLDGKIIATGPLLKDKAKEKSGEGKKVKNHLDKGELVPTELVKKTIVQYLEEKGAPWLLFDGFPRHKDQIEPLFSMGERMAYRLVAVFYLELPRSVAFERITGRRVCPDCGAVYNIHDRPPSRPGVCDRCGGELIQRKDDRPEVAKERMEEFQRNTVPVITFFQREYPGKTIRLAGEKRLSRIVPSVLSFLNKKKEEK